MNDSVDSFIHDDRRPTAENMSDQLAAELVDAIDSGDWELSDWHAQFIESNLGRTRFSIKQKAVILDLSRKFGLI